MILDDSCPDWISLGPAWHGTAHVQISHGMSKFSGTSKPKTSGEIMVKPWGNHGEIMVKSW